MVIMKSLQFVLFSLVFVSSAFANPQDWLVCSSKDDASLKLELGINSIGEPEELGVRSNLFFGETRVAGGGEAFTPSKIFEDMDAAGEFNFNFSDNLSVKLSRNAHSKTGVVTFTGSATTSGKSYSISCAPVVVN